MMNTRHGRWIRAWAAAAMLAAAAWLPAGELEDGIDLFRQGKYGEAEARLRKAGGPEAQAYLAGALAKQKKYGEAEGPAKAALDANPTHEVAVAALGESLFGLKKYDEAINRLSDALAKRADLAYAYFWRAQAYDKKGQAARMVADYEQFLKLAPKSAEAATVRGLLSAIR
jgi:tetratricopeptide (TPR) repeat protein